MRRALVLLAVLGGVTGVSAQAPESSSGPPKFEVSSVRENTSNDVVSRVRMPSPGQVAITNAPLRQIIQTAYGIAPSLERFILLGGGNDRVLSARFDITARPPDNTPEEQQFVMLQTLLAERFKLRIRREVRAMPVYELRPEQDGRTRPRMRPSSHNCRALAPPRPPRDVCSTAFLRSATERNPAGLGLIIGQEIRNAGPMSALVANIQAFADRPVLDRSGLAGNFEWHLLAAHAGVNAAFPSIATAVREQLGLRLEPARGEIELFVIDSVELPTPN